MGKLTYCLLIVVASAITGNTFAQNNTRLKPKKGVLRLINTEFRNAAAQYRYFKTQIPVDRLPKSLNKEGKLATSDASWWCSGFYPGTLFYLYENTGDTALYAEASKRLILLENEQYNKSTHDLGFMMYCSFGQANRLKPDKRYEQILVNSAKSLSTRFDERVGCIRSWDSKIPSEFLVIIDNMMNLELLFYATKVTGDSSFYKIAVTHANTTLKNHFRADNSSYHVVDYNPLTRGINKKRTHQGAADESAWARGQGWGLYGYTLMYRETGDKKYLDQANRIAAYVLNHPNLPADKIPYWDFNAPNIPGALRDASAGALMASAFIELAGYNNSKLAGTYLETAGQIIKTLSSAQYKAEQGSNSGFLLKHSVGSIPHKSEVDSPQTYADYYYVEAMQRYKNLKK